MPHIFADFGEIRYKGSLQNAAENFVSFMKICAGKAVLFLRTQMKAQLHIKFKTYDP
jgi:hypothetical protein